MTDSQLVLYKIMYTVYPDISVSISLLSSFPTVDEGRDPGETTSLSLFLALCPGYSNFCSSELVVSTDDVSTDLINSVKKFLVDLVNNIQSQLTLLHTILILLN